LDESVHADVPLLGGAVSAVGAALIPLPDRFAPPGICPTFQPSRFSSTRIFRYAMQGDTPKAKAAYQEFLTLWKDADPDISILIAAKAEYAKLK
jgi:hypothetical protein